MAEPTRNAIGIEHLIDATNPSGLKRVGSIKMNMCAWCGGRADEFRDTLSEREYRISGFCQECQDKTFGR